LRTVLLGRTVSNNKTRVVDVPVPGGTNYFRLKLQFDRPLPSDWPMSRERVEQITPPPAK